MGLTEGHWFEDEQPSLSERQLEQIVNENQLWYQKGRTDCLEEICNFLYWADCMNCRICWKTIGFCKSEEADQVCDTKERWRQILTKYMEKKNAR